MTISAICALVYGVRYCHLPESSLRSIVKTAAIGLLALVAGIIGAPVFLLLALTLSSLGDFALSRQGKRAFLIGLAGFALAHLFYILLFAGLAASWPAILPVTLLLAYAISTEFWLASYTGDMRGPVRVYVLLITGMGVAALALPKEYVLALIGAAAFMASDTLLAVQLFRLDAESRWQVPIARSLWGLYYGAQLLILLAILG